MNTPEPTDLSPPTGVRPPMGPWTRWWRTLVAWSVRSRGNALTVLVVGLTVAAACVSYGRGVKVNTDLKSLLPDHAPSVRALRELGARKGSTEVFTVAVEDADAAARQAMVDALAQRVAAWPEASEVRTGRDFTPLRDHALYFLEPGELDELARELRESKQRAIARKLARDVGGEGDGPVEAVVTGDDWDSFDEDDEDDWGDDPIPDPTPDPGGEPAGDPAGDPDATRGGADAPDLASWVADRKATLEARGDLSAREIDLIWPDEDERGEIPWRPQVEDPFLSTDGQVQVLKASLSQPPTDVRFAQEIAGRIDDAVAQLKADGVAPDARVQVVAAYNVAKDIDTILRDAKRATAVSVLLVVCVLVFGFRTVRALALVLVPMGVATAVTLALARALLPELNALTIFMFAVLFGMGVDFSVHLFALRPPQSASEEGEETSGWPTVIEAHLRPLTSSMLTTACSLAILSVADFKAFREFGAISAAGVVACFMAAVIFVPVVDTLWPARRAATPTPTPIPAARPRVVAIPRAMRVAGVVAVLATAAVGSAGLSFEKDLRQLNVQPKKGAGIRYGSATGRCAKSVVLVAEDAAGLDAAVDALTAEQLEQRLLPNGPVLEGRPPEPWVRGVYSVAKVLPEQQATKRARLEEVGALASDFLSRLPDLDADAQRYRTHLEALERMAAASPLTAAQLPAWARAPFVEGDGTDDRLGHVCMRIRNGHLDELVAVKARFDALIPTSVGRADSRLVFADLVGDMHVDAGRLPLASLLVILTFIALDLRRLLPTLACFGALVLGLAGTVGVMGLVPIHVNFFNLVVMPAVLGLSIDAGIHLWHARRKTTVGHTSRATIISALTTMGGFAGLLVAEHPGLRSIGTLGVVAVLCCISLAFLVLYPERPASNPPREG